MDAVVRALPLPLLLREISEDLSLVSRMLTPANQTEATKDDLADMADEQLTNSTSGYNSTEPSTTPAAPPASLDQLHLTSRLRTAGEELRRFRLLGLPSISDLANLTQTTLNRTLERLVQPILNHRARD